MKPKHKKGHWKEADFRYTSLVTTFEGLETSIQKLIEFQKKTEWYDGNSLKEDIEPIYGLALIALQNYINSSIYDFDDTLDQKLDFYKYGQELKEGVTKIELMICLANYFKHRDDSRGLHRGTAQILDKLNMQYGENFNIDNSPIFEGLIMLDPELKLDSLAVITKEWRESLWRTIAV